MSNHVQDWSLRPSRSSITRAVRIAAAGNVFWQVGSSAIIGTGSQFVGNIVANTSNTLNFGAGCTFTVTVQDNGEPGTLDTFGLTVTGTKNEVRSLRIISRGNIQFHF
jgi:hypothetical protein